MLDRFCEDMKFFSSKFSSSLSIKYLFFSLKGEKALLLGKHEP